MKLCIACWWLALTAFAGYGMYGWERYFIAKPPAFDNRDAGLDALALRRFGLENGAAVLRREIAHYGPDAPLMVFGPGDDWTLTEAYFLISYLAWPRPVWYVGMMPQGQKAKFTFPPPPGVRPAGLFFYKIAPPPIARVRPLSPDLQIGEFAR